MSVNTGMMFYKESPTMKNKALITIITSFILLASQMIFAEVKEEAAPGVKQSRDLSSLEGKTFYTKANIFYEKPLKIDSTNYHKGKIFPVGSKVTITFAGGREIEFKDDKGVKYVLILRKKHTAETMTLENYFDQYFSAENPLDRTYRGFTETEKWNIKNGTIEKGMSRAAVLMAYGYPPSHATPDLKDDKWTYWIASFRGSPVSVYFRDDRVYKIVGSDKLTSD